MCPGIQHVNLRGSARQAVRKGCHPTTGWWEGRAPDAPIGARLRVSLAGSLRWSYGRRYFCSTSSGIVRARRIASMPVTPGAFDGPAQRRGCADSSTWGRWTLEPGG